MYSMSNRQFEYDEELLSLCASFLLSNEQIPAKKNTSDDDSDDACDSLFQQHSRHYGRSSHQNLDQRQEFYKSILLVHRHNTRRTLMKQQQQHQVRLNQFSDMPPPPLSAPTISTDAWLELWQHDDWNTQTLIKEGMTVLRLHNEESIRKAASLRHVVLDVQDSNTRRHLIQHHHHQDKPTKTLVSSFIKDYPHLKIEADTEVAVGSITNHSTQKEQRRQQQHQASFETHVNWASTHNPDGVNIVHKAHDQGSCGSCWAFAATGTLEASASRRIAYQAYQAVIESNKTTIRNTLRRSTTMTLVDDATYNHAVKVARQAEQQAISVANSSVQELVDCDTWGDQGCTGGNPLLAFYFIHRYGLTSSQQYPYAGRQESCRVDLVSRPIASVESWGILTPNHEDNMQSVLRNIGPIAVGFNGADPLFLAYSGGIFDSDNCDQDANHALLIVGYGQERGQNGTTVKYWIARNSWGIGWGEKGYVRIKRRGGKKGVEGVCGIAKSPSVALGGILLPESGMTTVDIKNKSGNNLEQTERIETSLVYNHCESLRMGRVRHCNRIEGFFELHRALLYCFVSFVVVGCLVVFPLTRHCRQQRRQRRQALTIAKRARALTNPNSDESSSLLRLDQSADTYGSSA